jgi:hypothetical protein
LEVVDFIRGELEWLVAVGDISYCCGSRGTAEKSEGLNVESEEGVSRISEAV